MKYYLDTEFLEGTQSKKMFGITLKTPPTIDLISIGIVCEDDREYYCVSKDFNLKEAWDRFDLKNDDSVGVRIGCLPTKKKVYWLRENVLDKIFRELLSIEMEEYFSEKEEGTKRPSTEFTCKRLEELINQHGKSNKEIAKDVIAFCRPTSTKAKLCGVEVIEPVDFPIFYGHYADYDWVVFCWLFGKMTNLPEGFPMYCRDLKQILDGRASSFSRELIEKEQDIQTIVDYIKNRPDYPKQDPGATHSAIEDARWNKDFHQFLINL